MKSMASWIAVGLRAQDFGHLAQVPLLQQQQMLVHDASGQSKDLQPLFDARPPLSRRPVHPSLPPAGVPAGVEIHGAAPRSAPAGTRAGSASPRRQDRDSEPAALPRRDSSAAACSVRRPAQADTPGQSLPAIPHPRLIDSRPRPDCRPHTRRRTRRSLLTFKEPSCQKR